jgi:hypothetical protein
MPLGHPARRPAMQTYMHQRKMILITVLRMQACAVRQWNTLPITEHKHMPAEWVLRCRLLDLRGQHRKTLAHVRHPGCRANQQVIACNHREGARPARLSGPGSSRRATDQLDKCFGIIGPADTQPEPTGYLDPKLLTRPPCRPFAITRVRGFDRRRFWVWHACGVLWPWIIQTPCAARLGVCSPAMHAV